MSAIARELNDDDPSHTEARMDAAAAHAGRTEKLNPNEVVMVPA
jgi:hypothetical protein